MSKQAESSSGRPIGMKKIAFASMIGTIIEFYDFLIYGTAAALVFAKVFFPSLGQSSGTILALATFGVAFVARPLGSVIFGHFGDRLGRKKTLVSTLLLMGLSTVAIGLLPTAESIGVWAPIALVALRIAQGLAVGGEWAGAALLTLENAPAGSRGTYAVFPQLGASLAFSLASATYLVIALTISSESFLAWGWRIPFLASSMLVVVGLMVRFTIEETLEFKKTVERKEIVRAPIAETFREQGRQVLLCGLAMMPTFAFFYVGAVYMTTYATISLGLSKTTVLAAGVVAGLSWAATTIVGSVWSDRLDRHDVVLVGGLISAVVGLVLFPIIDIGTPLSFLVGIALMLGSLGFAYGSMGAMFPETFATRYRYSAAGISYSLGGVLGGAVIPLVATGVVTSFGSYALGLLLSTTALVGCASVLALRRLRPAGGIESLEAVERLGPIEETLPIANLSRRHS
ncbi:MFS transporter [Bradyrhizobium erythrophlei]|uniref:Predicted arabinose efflux permease, MFS family n=1 Tax=Bradyrhizobium erythrophlei TaxID=1437360 RepID=A0A1H4WY62_9BRAD|nr:MFS transporter [Bradyrhizobium erythrophlei]SEC98286.1 Predicted arabinose efflux permease, MFS family [Bradyrhizobium erythrophlei]